MAKVLSDEELRAAVRTIYHRGCRTGITSSRDHLMFLAVAATWGLYFDHNPMCYDELAMAGWFDAPGGVQRRSAYCAFSMAQSTPNCFFRARPNATRATRVFALIYGNPSLQGSRQEVVHYASHIWLERMQAASQNHAEDFITNAMRVAQELGVKGQDVVGYVCISLLLGLGFHRDPQFPWAVSAYADHAFDPPRLRTALAQGFMASAQKLQGDQA